MQPADIVKRNAAKYVLVATLTSPQVQKIDFWFGPYHVNKTGFLAVAGQVQRGSIGIEIGGEIAAGAAAQFEVDDNGRGAFRFPDPFGTALPDRMHVVHESTHAMFYLLYRSSRPEDTVNEGAAYVAGALYNIYMGSPVTDAELIPMPFAYANLIAKSIQNQQGAHVPERERSFLRAAVAIHPVYGNSGVTYDSRN